VNFVEQWPNKAAARQERWQIAGPTTAVGSTC